MKKKEKTSAYWDELEKRGLISKAGAETEKIRIYREEQERLTHSEKAFFSREEIERNPWMKDYLNFVAEQQRVVQAHEVNREEWMQEAARAYDAQTAAGTLSPLLSMLGKYLLYARDAESGLRDAIHLLFLQDPHLRLPHHNWRVLEEGDNSLLMLHGPKVMTLEVPLFPHVNPVHRERNTRILTRASIYSGGSRPQPREKFGDLFASEDTVLPSRYNEGHAHHIPEETTEPRLYKAKGSEKRFFRGGETAPKNE